MTLDEGVLHAEVVESLLQYIPTPEEIEQISGYPDDRNKLGKAEQFLWEIRVIYTIDFYFLYFVLC